MSDDHRLVDPGGGGVGGSERVHAAWRGCFAMMPDYRIVVDQTPARGETVVLVGRAGGERRPGRSGAVPATWRAVIAERRVREWQVYADNEPLRAIMEREATRRSP